ncbi:MAG: polysaccharide biosynthesis tyrosine autokinase [Chitinophagaceae bacterium]|nr:polysaccharide biosynthesis tyrosine autokinase [Chitinophagaceae bacterium]
MPTNGNKSVKKDAKSPLSTLLFKYMPYWPLFVVSLVLVLFAAWFYVRTTPPQFEINASIMLKDEKETRPDDIVNALDQLAVNKVVDNEIEILRSKTLVYDVVRRLHLYAQFYEEGGMIPKSAYATSPISIEVLEPAKIDPVEKIYFQYSEKDSLVTIGTQKYPINRFTSTPYGDIKFVLNPNKKGNAEKPLYFNLTSVRAAGEGILGSLRIIAASKQTTVVTLKTQDTDPRRGENVLNELIDVYNLATLNEKNRLAANTFDFVNNRLAVVEKELLEIEKKAQAYKSSRGAVDISTQGELFLRNIRENDQRLSDVNMQVSVLNEVEKYVKSKESNDGIVPSTVGLADPTMSNLVNNLYQEQLEYDKLKKTVGENNPKLIAVRDRIEKLRPSLLENIQNQRMGLEAAKTNLTSTINSYNSSLYTIPQKERELIDISRQQAIKSNLYEFLLQKKEQTELSVYSTLSDTRIVDKAQASTHPVSPKGKLIYMVALIFALAIPAGLVSLKELFNRKVLFRHEIEELTKAPIIGEISFDKGKDPIVIQEGKRTFIAEQFRKMRTSLGYVNGGNAKKKILVTSSLSGEGKSFVATNLAVSLALSQKKVVLVEFDLANPSLSHKLNVNYETGASNYLNGECEPEEIIRRTAINDNLFFLPAGPLPENPSELFVEQPCW